MMKSAVVVHIDENGEFNYHVYGGDEVRLFIVDERCPGDRVYEWLPREDPPALKAMLRDDPIGSSNDDRHEAIKHKILAGMDGKSHLTVVE